MIEKHDPRSIDPDQLVLRLTNTEQWINDPDLKRQLLLDTCKLILSMDTRVNQGKDWPDALAFFENSIPRDFIYSKKGPKQSPLYLVSNIRSRLTDHNNINPQEFTRGNYQTDILIHAHLDTVGFTSNLSTNLVYTNGDQIIARGVIDMKLQLSTIILFMHEIAYLNSQTDFTFIVSTDEEVAGLGSILYARQVRAQLLALDLEPTGNASGIIATSILPCIRAIVPLQELIIPDILLQYQAQVHYTNADGEPNHSIILSQSLKGAQIQLALAELSKSNPRARGFTYNNGYNANRNSDPNSIAITSLLKALPNPIFYGPDVLTLFYPDGESYLGGLGHNFATLLTLAGVPHTHIVSFAENRYGRGRHSDLEIGSIEDGFNLLLFLEEILKSTSKQHNEQ